MDNNRVPCSPDQIPDPNNPVTTPNLRNPYPVPVPAINSNKTSWSLKTPLSPGPYFKWKLFCCALFICLLCSFGIITYLGIEVYNSSNRSNNQAKNICLTPACVKTASSLLTAMDQTTSPCSDFFQFACGNWNKLHLIPEDRPSISTFEILSDSIQMELRRLLERNYTKMKVKKEKHTPSTSDSGSHGSAIRKVTDFYKSCMNLTSIRLVGEDPIIHLVRQLGGWPVVEGTSWRPTLSVEELIGKVRLSLNMGVLLELWIGPDDKNSSNNIIQIDQMQLGLPSRDYFLNISREIVAYHKYMVEIAVLFGADESFAAQDMNDVILFETTLANISLPEADRHDTSSIYRKQTLFSLETMIPGFDWKKYFNSFLVGPKITDEEKIVTYSFDYVEKMARVIEQTEPRVIQNYVIWRVLMDLTSYLLDKFQDSKIEFRKILMGVTSERSRWNQCVEWTNKKLGMGLGAMFIEDNFEHEAKETAQEMITEIRRALIELLDENHWMDTATRSVAKEKAMKMNERIGYPDYLTKPYELDKEYRNLTISQHHFVQNLINWGGWKARENLKKLKTPVDKEKWSTEPAVVNAFYDPNKNDIVFPAGILQPLFYSHTFPKSLNYGGIGVVIGHEITHGFDDKGRQFDWEGNLKEWWNNETIIAFRSQSQCIIDQYSQYEVGEEGQAWRIDGRLTVGENIADNGGLKQAYRAFKKWESLHGPEPLLPGLDHMTHDQYFFLNYAQIWCGSSRPEDLLNKIRSAVHSPGSIRVLGPLSNSIEFSKAFNCPLGTRMNPEQKCVVW